MSCKEKEDNFFSDPYRLDRPGFVPLLFKQNITEKLKILPFCLHPQFFIIAACQEPGDIPHAERSVVRYPYQYVYTCDHCYTGKRRITCLNSGEWSQLPICSGQQHILHLKEITLKLMMQINTCCFCFLPFRQGGSSG